MIDYELVKYDSKIGYYSYYISGNGRDDSIYRADSVFKSKLLYYTSHVPSTLTQPFDSLKKSGVAIATSVDGLFRIYNWDNETGGTMRFYDNVFQYKNEGKVTSGILPYCYSPEDDDPGCGYSDTIYMVKTNNKIYYIAIYYVIASSRVSAKGVRFFTVDNGKMNDTVHLIRTKTGLTSHIEYEIDNNLRGSDKPGGDGNIL